MMEASCASIEVEELQAVEIVPNNNMEQAIGSMHANNENQTQSVDAQAQGSTSENNQPVTSKIPSFMEEPITHGSWADEVNMNPPESVSEAIHKSVESVAATTKPVKKKKCKPSKVAMVKKPTECSIDKNKEKEEQAAKTPFSNWVEYKKNKRLEQERHEEELIRDLNGLDVSTTKKTNQGTIPENLQNQKQSLVNIITHSGMTSTSTSTEERSTTEELTTKQLQQAVAYLDNEYYNLIRAHAIQTKSTGADDLKSEVHLIAKRVSQSVKKLNGLTQNLVESFKNLATFVAQADPIKVSYAVLAAWVDELTHGIVAIGIEKDQIHQDLVPNFTHGEALINALQSVSLTHDEIREILLSSSVATAFAHKYVRTLQTYQLNQASRNSNIPFSELDNDYLWGSRGERMTHPFPESNMHEHLQLWKSTFSRELGIRTAKTRIYNQETNQISVREEEIRKNQSVGTQESVSNPSRSPQPGPSRPTHSAAARKENPYTPRKSVSPVHARKRAQSVGMRRGSPPRKQRAACDDNYSGCIFCCDRTHFSASCPVVYKLSQRREILFKESRCHLCLKRHLGQCRSGHTCAVCSEKTHHQAFCILNRAIREIDIREPRQQFYSSLVNRGVLRDIQPGRYHHPYPGIHLRN
ncbi:hypothetical protein ANCCAN_20881 [Ancylostoma caninum]|uniref:Zinc knuckle n=1 Tax=Ancylostoma caninum TaxID=29170 RepID=A0A368FR38_ANCCA|nr:hypothetical protein ANCCAN_20881 [Ancylostoma caninum]